MHYIGHNYDWGALEAEDCPRCRRPTLMGRYYGLDGPPVRLDAMPVRAFETVVEPPCGYVRSASQPVYVEHVCPLPG